MAHREQRRSDNERLKRNRDWVEWLARERKPHLRAIGRRYGIADQDLDDVIQSALAGVIRSYAGENEQQAVYRYAVRAVVNSALKAHRRRQRKEGHNIAIVGERAGDGEPRNVMRSLVDPSASDPLEQLIAGEAASELRARLEVLPEEQRTALILSAAGYGLAEIAEAMGLSVRATRKRIEKGNRALRSD